MPHATPTSCRQRCTGICRWMLVIAAVVFPPTLAHGAEQPIAPIEAPFPMPQLQRPEFAAADFPITDFGGRSGDDTDNTEAFAEAIAACVARHGGRVVVPAGRWRTGPIHLRSGVTLHLEDGAEIIFSDRFTDYLPPVLVRHAGIELYNYSPLIYARDCENVAITGPGRLHGNGKRWWDWKKKETRAPFAMPADVPVEDRVFGTPEAAIRPSFIVLFNCKNVLLEGFTITSGPNWTVHPTYCENVVIKGLTVDTHGPNNDGIDVDSCRNVLIEDCSFNSGDDCVVLKSGYNQDGWRVGRPTENVVMRRCRGRNGHGGLVIGSEMSGDVRNVFMQACEFDGTDHAVRIKSRLDRGGIVEKIYVDGVRARTMKRDVVLLTMGYTSDPAAITAARPPLFRDIHIKNVTAEGTPLAIVIQGLEESPISDCHFENLTIAATKGVQLHSARNISFVDCSIQVEKGPVIETRQVSNLALERTSLQTPEAAKVAVGAETSGVALIGCGFASEPGAVTFDPAVPPTAVDIR